MPATPAATISQLTVCCPHNTTIQLVKQTKQCKEEMQTFLLRADSGDKSLHTATKSAGLLPGTQHMTEEQQQFLQYLYNQYTQPYKLDSCKWFWNIPITANCRCSTVHTMDTAKAMGWIYGMPWWNQRQSIGQDKQWYIRKLTAHTERSSSFDHQAIPAVVGKMEYHTIILMMWLCCQLHCIVIKDASKSKVQSASACPTHHPGYVTYNCHWTSSPQHAGAPLCWYHNFCLRATGTECSHAKTVSSKLFDHWAVAF